MFLRQRQGNLEQGWTLEDYSGCCAVSFTWRIKPPKINGWETSNFIHMISFCKLCAYSGIVDLISTSFWRINNMVNNGKIEKFGKIHNTTVF